MVALSNRNLIICILLSILLLYSLYSLTWIDVGSISKHVLAESIILVLLALLFYFFKRKEAILEKQYITISNLALISIFIVHFFEYINFCIDGVFASFSAPYVVNKVSRISTCAYISILLGMTLPNKSVKVNIKKHINSSKVIEIFFLFSLCVFVGFTDSRYFSAGGNFEVLNSTGMGTLGAVGNVACIASILAYIVNIIQTSSRKIALSVKEYFSRFSLFFTVLLFIYLLLVLISGDRGPLVDVFLSLLFGFLILTRKKIKIIVLIFLIVLAALFFTFLAFLRASDLGFSIDKIFVVYSDFEEYLGRPGFVFLVTKDLSIVVNSFNLVAEYIETHGIVYGAGFIFQILAILPGIRYVLWYVTGVDTSYINSDQLATRLLDSGMGAGTTCISDCYLNVGILGIPIVFIFFGWFLKKLDISMYNNTNTFALIVCIAYFSRSVYIGRSTIFQPINLIVYATVFLYLSRAVFKK